MTTKQAKKPRKRKCRECGELKTGVLSNGLCEGCEEHYVYCSVCNDWVLRDDECRHLQWLDSGGCRVGCGSQDVEPEDHRAGFLTLLDLLSGIKSYYDGRALDIKAIRSAIAKHQFFTFISGPLIGAGGSMDFESVKKGDNRPRTIGGMSSFDYEEARKKLLGGDPEMGMLWLQSLQALETKAANRITVKWIDEWLKARKENPCSANDRT